MKKNSTEVCETYKYGVDRNDILVRLSDNWQSFSDENGGGEGCYPQNIIGSSLWRHVCEWQTRNLYEIILQRVREHNHRATFSFRCDSPEKRRFLTLAVIPEEEASIAFESTIINTELREPVALLNGGIKRSEEFLRICSMCKRIAISATEWVEVEIAVQQLGLFQKLIMPQLTHGVCQSCFDAAMAELDNH
jgi:hypothetical protein